MTGAQCLVRPVGRVWQSKAGGTLAPQARRRPHSSRRRRFPMRPFRGAIANVFGFLWFLSSCSGTIICMSHFPASPTLPSDVSQLDLYCLSCGYNLRGLPGDPRRCPECGAFNSLQELLIPARLIRTYLRKMESAPAVCVAAIVLPTICLLLTVALNLSMKYFDPLTYLVSVAAAALAPWVWRTNARRFRESCLDRAGWREALWLYHVRSLPLCLLVAVMIMIGTLLPGMSGSGARGMFGAQMLVWLAVIPVIAVGGPWVHRGLKEVLMPLQRDVAVALASRDAQRRREQHGR